jgi:hypothetical protein
MIYSQNLSLRTVAQPASELIRKFKACIGFLLSIPTTCEHRNRRSMGCGLQGCWDCGRIRFFGRTRWSVWHKGVR